MIIDWLDKRLMAKDDDSSGSSGKGDEGDDNNEENVDDKESDNDDDANNEDDEDEEEEGDDKVDKESGLTKAQAKEANELYKLLSNTDTRNNTLEILARQAGILGKQETKDDVKKDAKSVVQMLEEHLGPEMKWLAAKLAPAMEKILESERGSTTKTLDQLKQQQVQREVDQAYASLRTETKGLSRKFESKMIKLADEVYPAPGISVDAYVRKLYTLASAEGTQRSSQQKLAEKINRNSKDVTGRIQDSSSAGGGKGQDQRPVSAKDAVRQAAAKMGYKGD